MTAKGTNLLSGIDYRKDLFQALVPQALSDGLPAAAKG